MKHFKRTQQFFYHKLEQ